MAGRKVDGDRYDIDPGIQPAADLAARFVKNPVAEFDNERGFLRQRNELGWRHNATCRVVPAQQCFSTDEAAGAQAGFGLVVQQQPACAERFAQIPFELPVFLGTLIHFRAVEKVAGMWRALGSFQCKFGIAVERHDIVAVIRKDGYSDCRADMQRVGINQESGVEPFQQLLGNQSPMFSFVQLGEADGK